LSPTASHYAEYYAARGVVGALGALPWRAASAAGAALGAFGYRPLGIRRGVVERQIAAAFPEWSTDRVHDTARAAYENLGRTFIETAVLPTLGPAGVLDLFDGADDWHLVEEAMAAGRGLIFATGHLGNWELGGSYIAARGVPFHAVTRGMANPLFDRYITSTREGIGMRVMHDADAVRRAPRVLREGAAVAFVADQGVKGLASTFVPFFGRPAKTPRGPAVFALRLQAPIVFGVAIRQPSGRFRLKLEAVEVANTGDREADVDTTVANYTMTLERAVRAAPEQYFWHHRRWRRQPPGTPPELAEP
jgi:Kdo2-lipid IVA lauroyltransferase/acyltransferase